MSTSCTKHFEIAFKDEAGRRVYAQLIRLGRGDFRSLQLRTVPLRTLTLGVLIVSGGTLAALPFRRYQAIPDASAVPTQVTGPAQSALDGPVPGRRSDAVVRESPDAADLNDAVLASHVPSWQPPTTPRPRQLDVPLTYDDLAVPIDQPKPIQDRFNATAAVRQIQVERERVASLEMPPMESLVASQQEELQRVIASMETSQPRQPAHTPGTAGGALASTSLRPGRLGGSPATATPQMGTASGQGLEPLPEVMPPQRQRHWIRQPD